MRRQPIDRRRENLGELAQELIAGQAGLPLQAIQDIRIERSHQKPGRIVRGGEDRPRDQADKSNDDDPQEVHGCLRDGAGPLVEGRSDILPSPACRTSPDKLFGTRPKYNELRL